MKDLRKTIYSRIIKPVLTLNNISFFSKPHIVKINRYLMIGNRHLQNYVFNWQQR